VQWVHLIISWLVPSWDWALFLKMFITSRHVLVS
jgi:hypothetical protein